MSPRDWEAFDLSRARTNTEADEAALWATEQRAARQVSEADIARDER